MFDFAKWFRKTFRIDPLFDRRVPSRRPASSRRDRTRLGLEALEDRCLPTVTFTPNPAWGAPTATTPQNPFVLSSAPLTLVFWGDYWNSSPGTSQRQDIFNAAQKLFPARFGAVGYLRGVEQYQSNGEAYAVDSQFVPNTFQNGTFSDDQLLNTLENGNIAFPRQGHPPLVVFITPPGIGDSDQKPNFNGYHDWDSNVGVGVAYAWVKTPPLPSPDSWSQPRGGLDKVTVRLSHEVAEAMSDADTQNGTTEIPTPAFVNAFSSAGLLVENPGEISDNEPDGMRYVARVGGVGGVEAQAYWSQNAVGNIPQGVYVVPDGTSAPASSSNPNAQVLALNPQWNGTKYTGNRLTINGDQLSDTNNDVIILDTNTFTDSSGNTFQGVSVTLNGYTENFDPNQITSITVNPGAGNNQVIVRDTPQNVPVTINDTGRDTVTVSYSESPVTIEDHSGSTIKVTGGTGRVTIDEDRAGTITVGDGHVGAVQGEVDVLPVTGTASLTVDDSLDASEPIAELGPSTSAGFTDARFKELTGLTDGGIVYDGNTVSPTIKMGSGSLTVNATGTQATTIDLGKASAHLNGTSGVVQVNGGAGSSVTVGNGTLQNIQGAVSVGLATGGSTASPIGLTVDDSQDTTEPLSTLDQATFFGIPLPNVNALSGLIPTGDNITYDTRYVSPTVNLGSGALLVGTTGAQTTTVNLDDANAGQPGGIPAGLGLFGSSGPVDVYGNNGAKVLVGNGNTQSLGSVTVDVNGAGGVNLTVDDSSDTSNPSATLGVNFLLRDLSGLNAGGIDYAALAVSPTIDLGSGTLTVNATGLPDTTINATGANVNVFRTIGQVTVNAVSQAGIGSTVIVGSGTLAGIKGSVTVASADASAKLVVDDGNDTTAHPAAALQQATIFGIPIPGGVTVSNLAPADLYYQGNQVTPTFFLGANTNLAVQYTGSKATNIYTAGTGDAVALQGTSGDVTINSGTNTADTIRVSGTAGSLSSLVGTITVNGNGADTLDYSADTGEVRVDLPLGTATGLSGGVSGIRNVTGGQGNNILVGNGGNTLRGGAGRNLLIAGATPSTLIGNSGEDILVGGTTDYDTNTQALDALMAEWSRTDEPYASRVNDLLTGGGLPGTPLLTASNFRSNGGRNTLTGGPGLDLFYGLLPSDSSTPDTTDWNAPQGEVFVSPSGVHFQVGIDATRLSYPNLELDDQWISTAAPLSLSLAPGTHTLWTPTGSSLSFTVGASGVISYDTSLDGILSGQGTNQLAVKGVTVNVTQHLNDPFLVIDDYIVERSQPTFPLRLLPGPHQLSTYGGWGQVSFTVDPRGNLSWDPSLSQGTVPVLVSPQSGQLIVNGVTITIDATALSTTYVALDYLLGSPNNAAFQVTVLPGLHMLESYGGVGQDTFTVNPSASGGYISYDSSLSNVFTGQGTRNLTALGETVTIDTRALTGAGIVIDYTNVEAAGSQSQWRLMQGLHFLQLQGSSNLVYFTVNPDGRITFPASEDNELSSGGVDDLIVKALS